MDANTGNETGNQAQQPADKFANVNIPNPDENHNAVELRFGFRTVKNEETGVETKRPEVNVKLPVLNFNGVVSVLNAYASAKRALDADPENELAKAALIAATKPFELLMSTAVQGVYESAIKDFLADNPQVTTETFPYEQFTWDAIANQPESERKGRGIAKEIWEDFIKSYINVMVGASGKSKQVVEKQAAIIAQKFNPLKNHEDKEKILPKFIEALTLYMNAAGAEGETFAACVDFLVKKAEGIMNSDKNANLAANLGFE